MSLLCDYSDSSSSGSEDDERATAPPSAPVPRQHISLPSADELFASDTSLALSSSHSASAAYRSSATATSSSTASDAAKRRLQEQEPNASSKRLKPSTTTTTVTSSGAAAIRKAVTHFAPPQLKRPNVSTEDLGAWNTQKTLAMQQRKAKSQQPADS